MSDPKKEEIADNEKIEETIKENTEDVVDVAEIRKSLEAHGVGSAAKEANKRKQTEEEKKREEEQEAKWDKLRIPIYLGITFILTYVVEIFMIMPMINSVDETQAMVAQSLVASVMFLPAVGALFTRLITKQKMKPENLYLSLNVKKNLKYYAFSWFGFGLLIIFGAALYFVIFREQYDPNMGYAMAVVEAQGQALGETITMTQEQVKQAMLQQFILAFIISPFANIVNCFGEEWGWRGYLLPEMLKKFSVVPTLLISGLIWGLWHAPLTVMGHNYGVGYPGYPVVGVLAMCVFCIAVGICLSYVTIKTKSCVAAILGHGMINGFATVGIYFSSIEHPYNVFLGPAPTGLIGGVGFILVAAVLLFKLYKEEKEKAQKAVV